MWLGALRRIETKTARNIETDLEFVLRPRQPGLVLDHSEMATWLRPKPAESAPFSAGDDTPWASFKSSFPSFGFLRSRSLYIENTLSPDRAIGSERDAI